MLEYSLDSPYFSGRSNIRAGLSFFRGGDLIFDDIVPPRNDPLPQNKQNDLATPRSTRTRWKAAPPPRSRRA